MAKSNSKAKLRIVSPEKIQTNTPQLQYHNEDKEPWRRLPFVGGKSADGIGISFWNVPPRGGYAGGNETGAALAQAYVKHLSADGSDAALYLQNIVLGICEAFKRSKTDEERMSISGQIVGFFHRLDDDIQNYALMCQKTLSYVSEGEICRRANAGLTGWNEFEAKYRGRRKSGS